MSSKAESGNPLFRLGDFTLHSGQRARWKIDCDALTDEDWDTLAWIGLEKMGWPSLSDVIGIPDGGLRLAKALERYRSDGGVPMVVDDVLTTGMSMLCYKDAYPYALGLVVFARGECPSWVTTIFQM